MTVFRHPPPHHQRHNLNAVLLWSIRTAEDNCNFIWVWQDYQGHCDILRQHKAESTNVVTPGGVENDKQLPDSPRRWQVPPGTRKEHVMGPAAAEKTWRLTTKPWRHHLYLHIITTLFASDVDSIPRWYFSAKAAGSTPKYWTKKHH
jgi:hypothetical protein